MRKSHLKYSIIFLFTMIFLYNVWNIKKYDYYIEGYVLILFCISILLYKLSDKYFTMTLNRVNSLKDGAILEYDIISSNDNKTVSHIYVRTNSLFSVWRELDYCYTIMNNCHLGKAKLFEKKHPTSTELKKWMNKRAATEKNVNLAKYDRQEYIALIGTIIFISIVSCVLYFLNINFNVVW